jgi:hypothetical protein
MILLNPATLREKAPKAYKSLCEWITEGEYNTPWSDAVVRQEMLDHIDDQIRAMSARDAFDHILEWEGILGYTDFILRAVGALQLATEGL